MKRIYLPAILIATVLGMSSCRSAKEATPMTALSGEWDIVEINEEKLTVDDGKKNPTLVFNVTEGKISGFSGCNRMMGTFETGTPDGVINISSIATTRMSCPDMSMEQNIVSTLSMVKGYKAKSNDRIALRNADDRTVMMLSKRIPDITLEELNGSWHITEVEGETVPKDMENQPFIVFNIAEGTIHGNAGCNIFNGSYTTDSISQSSIMFPGTITTMMSCPDLEMERHIMEALNSVSSFDKAKNGVVMYNQSGEQILKLTKK